MSKHTPGPWEIRSGKFIPVQMEVGSKMYVIQTCDEHKDNVGFVCSWLDSPENLAEAKMNAGLIAAAPELLAALLAMVEAYEHEASPDNHALLLARAAIAKATT